MNTRDYRMDNIKGIMIFLVVLCHSIEKLVINWSGISITKHLYYAVYSFHMPVFVFISGYFSANSRPSRQRYIIEKILIPYVLINTVYDLVNSFSSGKLSINPFMPNWILWYLLSLFFWNVFIKYMEQFRHPLVLSICLALFSGTINEIDRFMSLSRTICFFPFFIAGYYIRKQGIWENTVQRKIISSFLLLYVQIGIALLARHNINVGTLYLASSYKSIGQGIYSGMLYRVFTVLSGFVGTAWFLCFIPDKKSLFSSFGKHSITIYIFHQAVLTVLTRMQVKLVYECYTLPILILFSLLSCFAFGNRYIHSAFDTLFSALTRPFLCKVKPHTFR